MGAGVKHRPTAKTKKLVGDLVLLGQTQEEIAARLKVCVETLIKHYYYEIYELKHDVNCDIENIVLDKARAGDWRAVEFWLKCKAGWAYARPVETEKSELQSLLEQIIDKIPNHGG